MDGLYHRNLPACSLLLYRLPPVQANVGGCPLHVSCGHRIVFVRDSGECCFFHPGSGDHENCVGVVAEGTDLSPHFRSGILRPAFAGDACDCSVYLPIFLCYATQLAVRLPRNRVVRLCRFNRHEMLNGGEYVPRSPVRYYQAALLPRHNHLFGDSCPVESMR